MIKKRSQRNNNNNNQFNINNIENNRLIKEFLVNSFYKNGQVKFPGGKNNPDFFAMKYCTQILNNLENPNTEVKLLDIGTLNKESLNKSSFLIFSDKNLTQKIVFSHYKGSNNINFYLDLNNNSTNDSSNIIQVNSNIFEGMSYNSNLQKEYNWEKISINIPKKKITTTINSENSRIKKDISSQENQNENESIISRFELTIKKVFNELQIAYDKKYNNTGVLIPFNTTIIPGNQSPLLLLSNTNSNNSLLDYNNTAQQNNTESQIKYSNYNFNLALGLGVGLVSVVLSALGALGCYMCNKKINDHKKKPDSNFNDISYTGVNLNEQELQTNSSN